MLFQTIWISRAQRSLKAMGVYLHEWRAGNFTTTSHTHHPSHDNREQTIMEKVSLDSLGTRIEAFAFPKYKSKTQVRFMFVELVSLIRLCLIAIPHKRHLTLALTKLTCSTRDPLVVIHHLFIPPVFIFT